MKPFQKSKDIADRKELAIEGGESRAVFVADFFTRWFDMEVFTDIASVLGIDIRFHIDKKLTSATVYAMGKTEDVKEYKILLEEVMKG